MKFPNLPVKFFFLYFAAGAAGLSLIWVGPRAVRSAQAFLADPVLPIRPASSKVAAPRKIPALKCCWCEGGNGSGTGVWLANSSCGHPPHGMSCRSVSVYGNGCSFFKVDNYGASTRCSYAKVTFEEGGKEKELPRPPGLVSPCAEEVAEAERDDGSPEAGKVPEWYSTDTSEEVYCSCGRDPSDDSKCAATKTVNGRTSVISSLPIPSGFSDCSMEACKKLYPRDDFSERCPKYIQGAP